MKNKNYFPKNFEKKSDFIVRISKDIDVKKVYKTFPERYKYANQLFDKSRLSAQVYIKAWGEEFLVY